NSTTDRRYVLFSLWHVLSLFLYGSATKQIRLSFRFSHCFPSSLANKYVKSLLGASSKNPLLSLDASNFLLKSRIKLKFSPCTSPQLVQFSGRHPCLPYGQQCEATLFC